MKQNRLRSSPLRVSEIGYGCMSLPLYDETLSTALLHHAIEAGVTFFDTADLYGQGANEAFVGKTLKPWRQQVTIATKVGNRWVPGESGWTWGPTKAYILQAVEDSLKRLQTDYIDLYQLHGGTLEDPMDDIIEAFESLVAKGTIRAYGISSIRPNVMRAYVAQSNIASVMMQYSLLDRRPEESALPLLREAGIQVIARGVVAHGRLAEHGHAPNDDYLGYTPSEQQDIRVRLRQIRTGGHATQLALRYGLSHEAVATVIPGASKIEQLVENIAAATVPPLTADEVQTAQAWYAANRYELHR